MEGQLGARTGLENAPKTPWVIAAITCEIFYYTRSRKKPPDGTKHENLFVCLSSR
jgi:hypothetical protein